MIDRLDMIDWIDMIDMLDMIDMIDKIDRIDRIAVRLPCAFVFLPRSFPLAFVTFRARQ